MKKLLFIVYAIIALTGCGGENIGETDEITTVYEHNIRKALNGKFHGERHSTVTNVTECEDIEFIPYDKPRQIDGFFGSFTAYGIAITCDYVNDNKPFASYRNYYSLDTRGDNITLSFHRCNEDGSVINREDRRILEVQTFDLFYMRPYGTTKENNYTYKRK